MNTMRESSDDRITKRIKEVMEQYEPEYSPPFWEKLRNQRPVPELRLKTLLLKYKFWLSVLATAGFLIIGYKVTNIIPADKNSAVDPGSSESANYVESEKPKEMAYSENTSTLKHSISDIDTGQEEKNRFFNVTPVQKTDFLLANYQNYTQNVNVIEEMPDNTEKNSVIPVLLEGMDLGYQYNIAQLIPIEYQAESIQLWEGQTYDKPRRLKFNWPDFNLLLAKEEGYDKFYGPNKFALLYSPEVHHSDSLRTLGVSHGIGISFEGPIRSLVSISAGLSYQAIDFHKTIFSEKVLTNNIPGDPIYIDSIGIRSGSYKYLEVPVSINFKFLESTRSQVWLGTGISSIVFLRQNYTSETIVGGISDQVSSSAKGWENVLPLASFNLSLLYRYQFGYRFFLQSSVQYKPHLVPLGYHSMKLNRLNFQVGIIYRFGRED